MTQRPDAPLPPEDVVEPREALPIPQPAGGRAGVVALWLASITVVIPVAFWVMAPERISSDAVGGMMMLCLLCCGLALGAFILGIHGRHRWQGGLAIAVSILGGVISFSTAGLLALGLALAGVNAGL